MAERIKGQEVTLQVVSGSDVEDELTEIMDFEAVYEMEIKEQGYLGQKHDQYDYIYKGISGKFSAHIHSASVFDFIEKIKNKAQRKTPDLVFNLVGLFEFPSNGEERSLTIPDVSWASIPINVGSRGDYVKLDFSFKASEALSV